MADASVAYIGLGANLGDARATLRAACDDIAAIPGCRLRACSSLWRSAPLDAAGPDFVNAVVAVETALEPAALLAALQAVEQRHGRQRPYRNAPRTLDLDLLLFGDTVVATEALTLPHPRMHERAFVLRPLLELAPDIQIPGVGPAAACLPAVAAQRLDKLPG